MGEGSGGGEIRKGGRGGGGGREEGKDNMEMMLNWLAPENAPRHTCWRGRTTCQVRDGTVCKGG